MNIDLLLKFKKITYYYLKYYFSKIGIINSNYIFNFIIIN